MDPNSNSLSAFQRFQDLNLKRRSDGSLYRSRKEMKEAYHNSKLFYPLSAIWNLDYCWIIVKSHIKNCFIFAIPLTLVSAYAFNPKVRTQGVQGKPFVFYVSLYILVYTSLTGFFMIDALAFCDYCKPWSNVYDTESGREKYKEMLKNRIKREQSSTDIIMKKTRERGLKDEEI
jgi:hypothetical protein